MSILRLREAAEFTHGLEDDTGQGPLVLWVRRQRCRAHSLGSKDRLPEDVDAMMVAE